MEERITAAARRLLRSRTAPVDALPTFETARPRPLPAGWSEDGLRQVLESIALDNAPRGELVGYVTDAFWRLLHTWGCVEGATGRALELGSNPYLTTYLLRRFTALDLTLANYFGSSGTMVQELSWIDLDRAEHFEKMESDLFNLEAESFPYADGSFDFVFYCEIIEHLVNDPMHSLREIHRVLGSDGLLVLTTPNVARLENVLALIDGTNIYDPYSGYGPYGRHNREYTLHDLDRLLRFAGFTIERQFTADAHPVAPCEGRRGYAAVAPELEFRRNDLGQYLFVVARTTSQPRPGLPQFLYRSYPPDQLSDAD